MTSIFERHRIPPPPDTKPYIDTLLWSARWYTKGNFTGYVYEGIIDSEMQGGGQGTIKLTIDNNLNIISFNVSATFDNGTNQSEWSCSGVNISPTYQTKDYVEYKIYHQNACDYLTNVYAYFSPLRS
ncbi:MAG: hypothetical protein P8Z35_08250 [Ignavibacteriaceae bacterium]